MAAAFSDLLRALEATPSMDGREMALVKTHLQAACFHAKRAMAMNSAYQAPTP